MNVNSTEAETTDESAHATHSQTSPLRQGLLYVSLATICFATSPLFTLWSYPFSAVEIAFWRLAIAALLVAILGLINHQSLRINVKDLPRFLFYGLITALHFFFFIEALSLTTVAHVLALTYTSPIFVTLFSVIVLREPLERRKLLGIVITVIGIAALVGFEPHYTACTNGNCMLLGDGMALLSSLCYAIYSIAGRGERDRHPLFRYTLNVYGLAALWLLPLTLFFAFQHPYPLPAVGAVLALGILPLGLGHTLYNASLRRIHATYANLIATQEVTLGVLLSAVFAHQIPSLVEIVGVVITLIGIIGVLI
ncbi:MAG TPA: EamA family transporter [Dictyobacter sp.]|jgi:drug/metabolite transporter (DMT)-like permease|nr:EamA family transporter [Dictyobacter sp.]